MEKRRKLLYSDLEGNVKAIMTYIRQLEKERDDALKQVEEWNESDVVFEAKRAQEEAEDWAEGYRGMIHEGFAPTPSKWNEIRYWENNHIREHHPKPMPSGMLKYNPNAPEFRYEFEYLSPLDGKRGRVTCLTCARKAFRRSLGIKWLYDRLCKKYDAKYDVGEI